MDAPRPARHATSPLAALSLQGVELLARAGLAARGVIYLIVGGFAVFASLHFPVDPKGLPDALQEVYGHAYGRVWLVAIVFGLGALSFWYLLQAAVDPEHRARGRSGVLWRLGWLISGLLHAGLTYSGVEMLLGARAPSAEPRDWTRLAMAWPLGRWAVVLVGCGIAASGLVQVWYTLRQDYRQVLGSPEMTAPRLAVARAMAITGETALNFVLVTIGVLLARAGLRADPSGAAGLKDALRALMLQPHGPWILRGVGVGLMAYGVHALIQMRYRRFRLRHDSGAANV